ncbi:MAG: metallophosphatase family protein [Flavobacteriales bacterium]|nr:metallophosphatase family protein [Flavobacteriales bacterium]
MKRIGLLSDTHGYIDNRILYHLSDCDEIWHAGDIGTIEVIDSLNEIARVRAVYGNIDGSAARSTYPLDCSWEVESARCFMTHIAGRPGKYPFRVKAKINEEKPDIFICGHSHILLIKRDVKTGLIHLNPGAAGKHGFHKMRTMLKFEISNGKIGNMQIIELGKRGF